MHVSLVHRLTLLACTLARSGEAVCVPHLLPRGHAAAGSPSLCGLLCTKLQHRDCVHAGRHDGGRADGCVPCVEACGVRDPVSHFRGAAAAVAAARRPACLLTVSFALMLFMRASRFVIRIFMLARRRTSRSCAPSSSSTAAAAGAALPRRTGSSLGSASQRGRA